MFRVKSSIFGAVAIIFSPWTKICILAVGRIGFLFGALFDAAELMAPEALEGAGPVVQRADGIGVGAIKHAAAVAANVNEADVAKHAEMVGHGRLLEP